MTPKEITDLCHKLNAYIAQLESENESLHRQISELTALSRQRRYPEVDKLEVGESFHLGTSNAINALNQVAQNRRRRHGKLFTVRSESGGATIFRLR